LDTATGKEARRLSVTSPTWIYSLRFGAGSKTLVLAGNAGAIYVVDAATGKEQQRLDMPKPGDVFALNISRDGEIAAVLSDSKTGGVWDLSSGKLLRTFKGLTTGEGAGVHNLIALTPDGKRLVHPLDNGSLHLMDVASGKDILTFETPPAQRGAPPNAPRSVVVSPDGRYLACGSPLHPVALCDMKTGKSVGPSLPSPQQGVRGLAFTPDSRSLAVSDGTIEVRIFDIVTGKEKHKFSDPSTWSELTFSPDGRMLASRGSGYVLNLWDVEAGRRVHSFSGHMFSVRSLAFFADGKRLASVVDYYPNLAIWDIGAGRILTHYRRGAVSPQTLRVIEDGATLQFLTSNNVLHRWKPPRGPDEEEKIVLSPHTFPSAVSPDGRDVMVSSSNLPGQAALQDTKKNKEARLLELPARTLPYRLRFSPDGRRVAAWCSDRKLRLWDRATGAEVKKVDAVGEWLLEFAADGRSFVMGGNSVRIIETATSGERLRLRPIASASALAYSPDNRLLACGCGDGRVVVFDAATGEKVAQWRGRLGAVEGLAFSRDGRLLASGGVNGLILVWRLPDVKAAPVALKAEQAAGLWRTLLSSKDTSAAHRAMIELAAVPAQAIPLIGERFRDARKRLSAQQLAHLVAELDDDAFKVRQRAERALAEAGPDAADLLRKALANDPSPEMKRRIKGLLDRLDKSGDTEPLRALRAIEVLERIGTKQARDALRELGRKSVSTELHEEIEASLRRLEERLRTTSEG
jgi:WD40 repeat protein